MSRFLFLSLFLLSGLHPTAFAHEAITPNQGDQPEPGQPVVVGMSNALSGPTAALGTELKQGAEAWFAQVNAAGGIHGRIIRLASLDDGYEPGRTISNTRILLEEEKAFLLFGYVGTPTSQVALPIARRANVPYVGPFTGATFLRNPVTPGVFNIRAGYNNETEAMVTYLVDKKKFKRIGLFIQDDAYGYTGRTNALHALAQRGLEPVAVGKYQRNTTDIRKALDKLKAAKPDAVIMVGAYTPCAAFIKIAKAEGFNPLFMNISFVGTRGLIRALGAEGEGVYITQVMPPPDDTTLPIVADYQKDMAKAGYMDSDDNYGALEGYVNARVLTRMLEAAGPTLTRHGFATAAEGLGTFDEGGLAMSYSATSHQAMDKVYLTHITHGKAVLVRE